MEMLSQGENTTEEGPISYHRLDESLPNNTLPIVLALASLTG
jgi:hypothetical protein